MIGVGIAGWYYWSGTVYHSLCRIQRAIQTHDRYLFEQYVDVESISRRLVDDFVTVGVDQAAGDVQDEWEQAGVGFGVAMVEMWKPRLIEQLRQTIVRAVESGGLSQGELGHTDGVAEPTARQDEAEAMPKITEVLPEVKPLRRGKVSVEGRRATVALVIASAGEERTLRFRLVRVPARYWRVTEIENFPELLRAAQRQAKLPRGWFGVQTQDVTPEVAASYNLDQAQGVRIYQVVPESPADMAGLAAGDVIRSFDGSRIVSERDLVRQIEHTPVGKRVVVEIVRERQPLKLAAHITARPTDAELNQRLPRAPEAVTVAPSIRTMPPAASSALPQAATELTDSFQTQPLNPAVQRQMQQLREVQSTYAPDSISYQNLQRQIEALQQQPQ